MFELSRADEKTWRHETKSHGEESVLTTFDAGVVFNMCWEEHCVECTVPECHATCMLYKPRADGECARFVYGIFPNKNFKGRYGFGADIRFRRWGKLEVALSEGYPSPPLHHRLEELIRKMPRPIRHGIHNFFRKRYGTIPTFDFFIAECYSFEPASQTIILEHFHLENKTRTTRFRTSITLHPGRNCISIPYGDFNFTDLSGYLYLCPENASVECRVIFTWLDFVKTKENARTRLPVKADSQSKVKCLVWDLDNTLWHGTLAENENVTLNDHALKLLQEMDRRGIIQSIASKNDFTPAWNKLQEFALDGYFLAPQINWDSKSNSILTIAQTLNIDISSIAFVDDSDFEREEVTRNAPGTRVYQPRDIRSIAVHGEFMHPITSVSKGRRQLYQMDLERTKRQTEFSGNYTEFLIDCQMKLRLYVPSTEEEIDRCYELIQRSNQLNLSTNRYDVPNFRSLLRQRSVLPIAINCRDRFGEYGNIAFISLRMDGIIITFIDMVISCRAAQKGVEETSINTIASLFIGRGFDLITIPFRPTGRNTSLLNSLERMDLPYARGPSDVIEFYIDTINFNAPKLMTVTIDGSIQERLKWYQSNHAINP